MLARLKKWFSSVSNIKQADQAVVTVDALDIGVIFGTEEAPGGQALMEGMEHYFLFGFAWAASIIRTIFAWRQFHLQKNTENRNTSLKNALVETIVSASIGVAVLGGFVGGVLFALAAPVIFVCVLGMKSILHLMKAYSDHQKAGKCVAMLRTETDGDTREQLIAKQKAFLASSKSNLISGFGLAFVAVAVGLVMIAAKPVFAVFGIVGGLMGMINSIKTLIEERKKAQLAKSVSAMETGDESHTDAAELRPLLTQTSTRRVSRSLSEASPVSTSTQCPEDVFEPGSELGRIREELLSAAAILQVTTKQNAGLNAKQAVEQYAVSRSKSFSALDSAQSRDQYANKQLIKLSSLRRMRDMPDDPSAQNGLSVYPAITARPA